MTDEQYQQHLASRQQKAASFIAEPARFNKLRYRRLFPA
jgi:hypothetical protein